MSTPQNRPRPIRIPDPSGVEHLTPANGDYTETSRASPSRSALIAGLRSATDRRRQAQLQLQQQQYIQSLEASSQNNEFVFPLRSSRSTRSTYSPPGSGSAGSSSVHLSPPVSPLPYLNHAPGSSQENGRYEHNGYNGHNGHHKAANSIGSVNSLSLDSVVGGGVGGASDPSNATPTNANYDRSLVSVLYMKQQELIATAQLINQQQQKLQAVMNQANGSGSGSGSGSPSGSGTTAPIAVHSKHTSEANPNDIDFDFAYPRHSQSHSQYLGHGHNSGSWSYGPSSPSVPARPSSTADLRQQSLLFGPNYGFESLPGGGQTSTSTPFKRGHRKASSLSSSINATAPTNPGSPIRGGHSLLSNYDYANVSNTSGAGSPLGYGGFKKSTGVGTGAGAGAAGLSGFEVPLRQPIGPPPLDEIKSKGSEVNFARNRV